jgi:hypothetical protein
LFIIFKKYNIKKTFLTLPKDVRKFVISKGIEKAIDINENYFEAFF